MEIDFDQLKNNVPLNLDGTDDYEYVKANYSLDGESAMIYKPEIDDFITASTNAQLSKNPEEKFTYWFALLYSSLFIFYGFDKLLEKYDDFIILIPKDEDEAIWHVFQYVKFNYFRDNQITASEAMIAIIQAGETFKINRYRDEDEYQLTDDQIKGSINLYDNADKEDKDFKKWFVDAVEDGCEREIVEAMEFKAYALYYGNEVYKKNLAGSRDLLEKLFEMTLNPSYANDLGYMYYYGDGNNNKPDYDKAFKYFTIGHLDGHFESTYKLADMLANGQGVPKNPRKAVSMVAEIYGENFERFCMGDYRVKLPDVAYRIGGFLEKGLGVNENIKEAYRYYLIAACAIEKRMENFDFPFDDEVRQNIGAALTRLKEKLDDLPDEEKAFDGESKYKILPIVNEVLDSDTYMLLKISKYSDSEIRLDFKCYRKIGEDELIERNFIWAETFFDEYKFGNEFTVFAKGEFEKAIKNVDNDIDIVNDEFTVLVDYVDGVFTEQKEAPIISENMSFEDTMKYAGELLEYNNRPKVRRPYAYVFTQNNHVEFRLDSMDFVIKKEFFNME